MNCWKSINIAKEYGNIRLWLMSSLIGLSSFVILYVPFSMIHKSASIAGEGIILFILALVALPALRMLAYLLPAFILNKPIKIKYKTTLASISIPHCRVGKRLSKRLAFTIMLMPTLLITMPGLVVSTVFSQFFVYALGLTAVHLGLSLKDFLYIKHILRAPKTAVVEDTATNLDILVHSKKGFRVD